MSPPPADRLRLALSTALAQHQRGELAAAKAGYQEILALYPRSPDALYLLGLATADLGSLDDAIALIGRAIDIDDAKPHSHYALASLLIQKGDEATALGCLDRAVALKPDFADAWLLRGNTELQSGRMEAAVHDYDRALLAKPDFAEVHNNRAAALRALRRLPAALESADRALTLRPVYAKAYNNRGLILLDAKQGNAAVGSFRQALAIEPGFAEALHNLGSALMQLRRYPEARDAFAQLSLVAPGFNHVRGNLLHARLNCCDWSHWEGDVNAVVAGVQLELPVDVPMSFLCVSDSAVLQLHCAQAYAAAFYPSRATAHVRRRHYDHDLIRIAYLSGDFGEHAVSYLLAGVFERHNAKAFEIYALSWGRRQDDGPMRRRLENSFSRFVDVTDQSDAEVAGMIEELEVDIAVDLTGHTLGQRTGILALRPASVQVNYLGLPAGMGAPYIDYLIADRFLVPEEHRRHYTEHIIWLPGAFQPNDDRRCFTHDPSERRDHGLPDTGTVFCSFNRSVKLNPPCFAIWMRLLRRVPDSVLWLLATSPLAEQNLRHEAAVRGVDPKRLVFANEVPYAGYLARYAHADLILDSFPFNGGTTVSDALSMGAPVLSCAGNSFAARMGGTLLTGLGLSQLVTHSLEEYEAVAYQLASDPDRLRALRRQLIGLRSTHALFDTERYRENLEAAYRMMWERNAAGLPPAAFAVADQKTTSVLA